MMVYFRFRSAQKLTEPIMHAAITVAAIANSALTRGASESPEVDSSGIEVEAETEDCDAESISLASPKQYM